MPGVETTELRERIKKANKWRKARRRSSFTCLKCWTRRTEFIHICGVSQIRSLRLKGQ